MKTSRYGMAAGVSASAKRRSQGTRHAPCTVREATGPRGYRTLMGFDWLVGIAVRTPRFKISEKGGRVSAPCVATFLGPGNRRGFSQVSATAARPVGSTSCTATPGGSLLGSFLATRAAPPGVAESARSARRKATAVRICKTIRYHDPG
jgi:hypothetical protein